MSEQVTKAVVRAYNAAALKATDAREECGPGPIDHAAQAALENSDVDGQQFDAAYNEVFETIHKIVSTNDTSAAADKIQRVKHELA